MPTSSDISAAVDAAAATQTPASPDSATPATTSPATPVETPLTSTPAPRSGPERRSDPTAQPEGATTPPAVPVAASTSTSPTGSPPEDRWPGILDNARRDTREKVIAEDYGGIAPDVVAGLKPHIDLLSRDMVGYYHQLGEMLTRTGRLQPSPSTPAPQTAPVDAPEPSLTVMGEDGRPVGRAYSAEDVQKLLAFHRKDWDQQIDTRVKPLEQMAHELEVQKINVQAKQIAETQLDEANKWEGFKELRGDIFSILIADRERNPDPSKRMSLGDAWRQAFHEKHLPTLNSKARQEAIQELKTAPVASTLDPAQPQRGSIKPVGDSLGDQFEAALVRAGMRR